MAECPINVPPPTLHICNVFFESELETDQMKPLAAWMRSHPVVRQLQPLPLLYTDPEDLVLITDLPEHPDPRLRLADAPLPEVVTIEHWGPSRAIAAWAKERNIPYAIPDWETIRMINSKIFSFTHSPVLPFASLLQNEEETLLWIRETPGPKVLKTAFGTAGYGHFHIPGKGNLASFLKKEFAKGHPLIGEPWVERILDFSTQWKDGHLLGATLFENDPKGRYLATFAGPRPEIFGPYEWALLEHLDKIQPLLKKIGDLGFFGNLGVDAYVYRWGGKEIVQPVVEINGRKTMSWAALQIQERKYPHNRLRFSFSPKNGVSYNMIS